MAQSSGLKSRQADHGPFTEDVAYFLSQSPRQLPSQYLYDELGSALFEAICHLPWYHVARLEQQLLRLHGDDIFKRLPTLSTLVELGSGNGEKLATLMNTRARGSMAVHLAVHLVDVSSNALGAAIRALNVHKDISVVAHQATYEAGLAEAARDTRSRGQTLVLFLGSNIGNFDPSGADALLRGVRATLSGGDALLLGADLVKPERELLLAYDDPLGVTAAFNRNLLVRANRELGADFDVDGFAHRAVWNRDTSRMEMYLVSVRQQHVRVPAAGLNITFQPDEAIWTESSYKYRPVDVLAMLDRGGFDAVEQWTLDGFALTLGRAR